MGAGGGLPGPLGEAARGIAFARQTSSIHPGRGVIKSLQYNDMTSWLRCQGLCSHPRRLACSVRAASLEAAARQRVSMSLGGCSNVGAACEEGPSRWVERGCQL